MIFKLNWHFENYDRKLSLKNVICEIWSIFLYDFTIKPNILHHISLVFSCYKLHYNKFCLTSNNNCEKGLKKINENNLSCTTNWFSCRMMKLRSYE